VMVRTPSLYWVHKDGCRGKGSIIPCMESVRLFLRMVWLKLRVDWTDAQIALRHVQIALLRWWMRG
jgi:hypothetical protein